MKVLKRLAGYVKPLHHFYPEYIIYTLFGIVFGIVNFTMLIPIMNTLFGVEQSTTVTQIPSFTLSLKYFVDLFNYYFNHLSSNEGKMYAMGFVCSIIALSTLLANLFRYLAVRCLIRFRLKLLQNIRMALFEKFMQQSQSYYHKSRKGNLIEVTVNETQEMESAIINFVQVWLRDPFVIIAYFVILFVISFKLTLFTIIFLPVSGLIISFITKQLKQMSHYSQDKLAQLTSATDEGLSGIKIIQSFSAEQKMQKNFFNINRLFTKISRKLSNKKELTSPISESLGVFVVVVLVMYGAYLLLNKEPGFSGANFVLYLTLYSQIIQPLKALSNSIASLQRGIVAAEKIFIVLDEPVAIEERSDAVTKKVFDSSIEFKNVTFKYDITDVLKNISFTIKKGTTVALVGESGSGKTTIADMISRFYDPQQGDICIDGTDIKSIKLNDLRGLIAVVSQDTMLFHDSVKNNIAFAKNGVSKSEIIEAAKIANADTFINDMENDYDTIIGDRGIKMSGGQRQRLTIARAVLKNAPILILDEATSALDTENERLVQDALQKLMKERTSVVIAHRLSTVRHADEIIVLQKGEIVEKGTHDELISKNGYYKHLVDLQELK